MVEVVQILHPLMAETVAGEQEEVAQLVMKPEFLERPFTMLVVVGEQGTLTVLTERGTETPQTEAVADNLADGEFGHAVCHEDDRLPVRPALVSVNTGSNESARSAP